MKKYVSVIVTLAVAGVMTLSGCGYKDPCRTLPAPSPAELAAAQSGADIERDVNGVECDLEGGQWQRDADTRGYKSSVRSSSVKPTTKATVKTTAPKKTTAVKR